MLRRPATTIKLTPEDVLEYDDNLLDQQSSQNHTQQLHDQTNDFILQEQMNTSNIHNNSSNDIAKEQSKDERIGAIRNN